MCIVVVCCWHLLIVVPLVLYSVVVIYRTPRETSPWLMGHTC